MKTVILFGLFIGIATSLVRAEDHFTSEEAILAVSREDQSDAVRTGRIKEELTITAALRVLTTYRVVSRETYLQLAHRPGVRGTVTLKQGGTYAWAIEPNYAATIIDDNGKSTIYLLAPAVLERQPGTGEEGRADRS